MSCFTPDLGKIKIKARGARKPISKMAPFLEYFSILKIYFTGKKEIKVLTNLKQEKIFNAIQQDFRKTNYAYFLLELTEKSLALEKPQKEEIFELLTSGMEALDRLKRKEEEKKIIFLYTLKLFYLLGYLENYKIKKSELANIDFLRTKAQKVFQDVLEKNLKSWEMLEKFDLL